MHNNEGYGLQQAFSRLEGDADLTDSCVVGPESTTASPNPNSWRPSLKTWASTSSASKHRTPSPEESPLLEQNTRIVNHGSHSSRGRRRSVYSDIELKSPSTTSGISLSLWISLMLILLLISAVFWCTSKILSHELTANQYCGNAVYFAYNYLSFAGSENATFWDATCRNTMKVTSLYAATKHYCRSADLEPGLDVLRQTCLRGRTELLDLAPIEALVTDEYIGRMRLVDFKEVPRTIRLTEPVLLSRSYFDVAFKTLSTWHGTKRKHHEYGFLLYAFWGGIVIFGIISNLSRVYSGRKDRYDLSDVEGTVLSRRHDLASRNRLRAVKHWLRTNLMIPATIGSRHQRLLYWCTIPTRFESTVVFSFWALSIFLSCISYTVFSDNIFFPEPDQQFWRYVSDRTGIMAYATLPLMWMFAGRNNVLLWATGWSFQTFNIFHRHVARVGTVLAIVHSVGYAYLYCTYQSFATFQRALTKPWLLMGLFGTAVMSTLLVFSVAWLRMNYYETFLILHIVLSLATIGSVFMHTSIFGGSYDPYLWPVLVIWGFDRSLRVLRVISCNLGVRFSRTILRRTHTVAHYSKDSDVIRLDIDPGSALLRPAPGQYYYLYQPFSITGYESHPFTLGAWAADSGLTDFYADKTEEDEPLMTDPPGSSTGSQMQEFCESAPLEKSKHRTMNLVFWIRPCNGWTKRLRESCLKSSEGVISPTILIEGPYGHFAALHTYDTVLLIAGGTGIASVVPYVLEHMERSKSDSTRTKSMRLIWTARHRALIEEICCQELALALCRQDFHPSFFVTSRRESDPQPSLAVSSEAGEISPARYDVQYGRPDIDSVISEAASEAKLSATSVAVLVCGPSGMADQARASVHHSMKAGCQSIEYIEEAYGW